jgi:hypothetical protein
MKVESPGKSERDFVVWREKEQQFVRRFPDFAHSSL